MGQELHSCDTTQIDACASARCCVPSYASRWITGGHPSAPTCIRPDAFRPPSKVHSPYAVPLHSHRRQLSDARFCKGTPLSQRFRWYFVVGAIIAAPHREVNRQFKRKKQGGRPIIFCIALCRPPGTAACRNFGVSFMGGARPFGFFSKLHPVGIGRPSGIYSAHPGSAIGRVVPPRTSSTSSRITFFVKLSPCILRTSVCTHTSASCCRG